MIHFVTTRDHAYTVKSLVHRHGQKKCRVWSYEQLFRTRSVPSGTWIFTDHERLSGFQLRRSAKIANKLVEEGARVINHPALVRNRFETLRRFAEAGINQFGVMRCESDPRPSKFPVFIRNSYDHDSDKIELIDCQEDLDIKILDIQEQGIPLDGKLVIEFNGEELLPSVWARSSSYCVAGKIIAHHMAFDDLWIVKDGFDKERLESHPNKQQLIELEREFVSGNQYADVLEKAFAMARIEYGRADCSIVNNRLQIYEINTNPHHCFEHEIVAGTHPDRLELQKQSEDKLQQAIINLDTIDSDNIIIGKYWWKAIIRPYWKASRNAIRRVLHL